MEDIFFFDANVQLGFDNHRRGASTAELLADMDYYGIEKALVRSRCTGCSGAVIGNQQIIKALSEDTAGRLTGVWCVLPSQRTGIAFDKICCGNEKKQYRCDNV